MPCDYGRTFHDIQNIGPARPHDPQHDPKEPVKAIQHRSPTLSLQHRDLLAQGKRLRREVKATAKENSEGGENFANDLDHKITFSMLRRCPQLARLRVASYSSHKLADFDHTHRHIAPRLQEFAFEKT